MKAKRQVIWAVYFVGWDDTGEDPESRVDPYVGKERVETTDDPEQATYDAQLSVLARGGELLAVVNDDEVYAEALRLASELEMLRGR